MKNSINDKQASIEYCREQVAAWQASGLSEKAYCSAQGFKPRTLSRYKMRVARHQNTELKTQPSTEKNSFAPLNSPQEASRSKQSVEIIVADCVRLRFPDIVNPASIVRLIKELTPCS